MPIGVYERTELWKEHFKKTAGGKIRLKNEKIRQDKIEYINKTGLLQCNKCKKEKTLDSFQSDKKRWSGKRAQCKDCCHTYYAKKANEYYYLNKEKISEKSKWYRHKYELNFSKEDYYKLLSEQGGGCAICKEQPKGWLCIDHNHKTNKVRGLLCRHCNVAIGFLKDNITVIKNASSYLEERGSYGQT